MADSNGLLQITGSLRPATSGPGGSCTHDDVSASNAAATTTARSARADLLLRARVISAVADPLHRGSATRKPLKASANAAAGHFFTSSRGVVRTGGVEPPQPEATGLQPAELAHARRPRETKG